MNAFLGYNQIQMATKGVLKIDFVIHRAIYAFKDMSFGLINVDATYQWMMNQSGQVRKKMEVYVDHMIVKSQK